MGRNARFKQARRQAEQNQTASIISSVAPKPVEVVSQESSGAGCVARQSEPLDKSQLIEFPMVLNADGQPYKVGNGEGSRTLYAEPIAVGYVHGGMLHEGMARSLMTMIRADSNLKILLQESSCNLPLNRNELIRKFVEAPREQGEWLLFIDSDVTFPAYTAALMLKVAKETNADIVAVPYLLTNGSSTFGVAIPGGGYQTQATFTYDRAYEIGGAGTGMMLIKRDLLERMRVAYADKEPWPWCGYDHITIHGKPQYESEDYSLCRRATQIGAKIVGYTGVVLGHLKVKPLSFAGLEDMVQR
jgi:hypothetical protein